MGRKKVVKDGKKVVTGRKKVVMIPLGHRTFANEDTLCFCVLSTDSRNPTNSSFFLYVPRSLVLGLKGF